MLIYFASQLSHTKNKNVANMEKLTCLGVNTNKLAKCVYLTFLHGKMAYCNPHQAIMNNID